MTYSLYDAAVTPCAQQLGALAGIIDKAAAHCTANKIEESALLQDRLYPDMFCLARQIRQSADFGMNTGARLAGVTPPALPAVDDASFADAKQPCRDRFGLREGADPRAGRRRRGQDDRLDCRRQRAEDEGARLSATVRPPEFLLLRHDGVRHPAPSRRAGRQAGLPRPGQLALIPKPVLLVRDAPAGPSARPAAIAYQCPGSDDADARAQPSVSLPVFLSRMVSLKQTMLAGSS